jgi:hypothetical protein
MPSRHHRSRRSRRSPSPSTSYSSSSYTSPSPRKSKHRHRSKSRAPSRNRVKEEKWPLTPAFTIAPLPRTPTPPRASPPPSYNRRDRYSTVPNATYTTEAWIRDETILQTDQPKDGQIKYNTRFVLPPDLTTPLPTTQRTFNIRWDDCIRHRGVVLPFGQYRDALIRYHNTMPPGVYPYPDLMDALKLKKLMDEQPTSKRADTTTTSTEITLSAPPPIPITTAAMPLSSTTPNAPDEKAE